MALDTNNNFVVTGSTAEASIATDYSLSETSHFQVMKMAYGSTAQEPIRVTDTTPLPVDIMNNPTVNATVSGSVSVSNNVAVYGIVGATAIGVTASDLDIRNLTAGSVTAGDPSTSTIDIVRVIGYSGGYPVGVSASDFDIRNLSAGSQVTVGDPSISTVDIVRVIGYSGGYPIGVSATDLDIRNLTFGSDSVSVLGGITVSNGQGDPYDVAGGLDGFGTRILRATKDPTPISNVGTFISSISSDASFDDTVRVVGLSGAYPVDVLGIGVTNIANRSTRVPFHVDDTGALYVNLASGTINVTASVSSSAFTLAGVSLAGATTAAETIQIRGYTGPGAVAIEVTAADLDIRGLSSTIDSVYADTRFLGSCADNLDKVALTGDAHTTLQRLYYSFNVVAEGTQYRVATDDVQAAAMKDNVATITTDIGTIQDEFFGVLNTDKSAIKTEVTSVAQPTGITSGWVNANVGSVTQLTATSVNLNSGVHLKTSLNNATSVIFVQSSGTQAAGRGYPLFNGDQIFIEIDNLNKIWLSAETAGGTLYYIAT
jgi:hypothetical protein